MSKHKKLIRRLLSRPKDLTWDELVGVLKGFGYKMSSAGKTSGSRVRFIHAEYPPILLHKPHPDRILKRYQINDVVTLLEQEELL